MQDIVDVLVRNSWVQKMNLNSPPPIEAFPEGMPEEVYKLCTRFEVLSSPDDTTWFFGYKDYLNESESAFKWNEFELNDSECAVTEHQREAVRSFWKRYFPIAMCVRDDHRYIAVGRAADNFGKIILGENSDEAEITVVAENMFDFARKLDECYSGRQISSPLSRFLA